MKIDPVTLICIAVIMLGGTAILHGVVTLDHTTKLNDLSCRIARIETYAVSAEPLPDCTKGANPKRPVPHKLKFD